MYFTKKVRQLLYNVEILSLKKIRIISKNNITKIILIHHQQTKLIEDSALLCKICYIFCLCGKACPVKHTKYIFPVTELGCSPTTITTADFLLLPYSHHRIDLQNKNITILGTVLLNEEIFFTICDGLKENVQSNVQSQKEV